MVECRPNRAGSQRAGQQYDWFIRSKRGGDMGLGDMVGKAKDLAGDHSDKAKDGIDKAADAADSATGGKATDQINSGADKAKDFIDDQKN